MRKGPATFLCCCTLVQYSSWGMQYELEKIVSGIQGGLKFESGKVQYNDSKAKALVELIQYGGVDRHYQCHHDVAQTLGKFLMRVVAGVLR